MKHKSLICLVLILLVTFSVFTAMTHFTSAQTAPVISIVPTGASGAVAGSITNFPAQGTGTTFQVDVRVDNYASVNIGGDNNGVSGISFVVTWDPTVLQYVSKVDASWLPSQANQGDLTNKVSTGQLTIGQVAFDTSDAMATASSASGSVSVTITFKVLATGGSSIALSPQTGVEYLSAPETVAGVTRGQPVTGTLTANAQYGTSNSPTPTPTASPTPTPGSPTPSPSPSPSPTPTPSPSSSIYGPTSIISIQNGTIFQTGDRIILDGSLSTPGYDGQTCPITNYAWLVQYLNNSEFGVFSGSIISIAVNNPTDLRLTLIVTAKDVNSSPSSLYSNTSVASIFINVKVPQQLVKIDIFTNKGGQGFNVSSGSFGPNELVQLYAYVSYNGASEPNENVAFTVINPNGTIISIRSAFTNSSGYAYQDYRTPNLGSSNYGIWTVLSSVEVNQVVVTDSVSFQYNSTSIAVGINIPTSVHRGSSMTINVTLQNIASLPSNAAVTISVYDQNDVPIYSCLNYVSSLGSGGAMSTTFTVPAWAFVGQATVYVNILSNNPLSGGVPLMPEQTATFQILS